jgi:hypothetical protein
VKIFIRKNAEFLSCFHQDGIKGNLLVEEMGDAAFINHCMCMQMLILNQALGYRPVFLQSDAFSRELVQSYVPTAISVPMQPLSFFEKVIISTLCRLQLLKVFLMRNILVLRYGGVQYGDIVYDTYLADNSVGTFDMGNWKAFREAARIFVRIAVRHHQIKKIIRREKIDAVLVSHKIGMWGGVLTRAALVAGRKVYANAGMHRNTLYLTKSVRDMKAYGYSPTKQDIEYILGMKDFDARFEAVKQQHLYGLRSSDAKYAFNDGYRLFEDRGSFCLEYGVDVSKKNIFVMLHAFTDHPHSHFPKMLFRDYKDWFIQTLDFAKNDKSVNWFFKQHPSDRFYPVHDVDFAELFAGLPDNIVFIDSTSEFDARNLKVAADAVVTCIGSAGFEMPAFYGIPSITAGDNSYSHLGFACYPRSRRAYFSVLGNSNAIKPLSPGQRRIARAFYMFTYEYATVDYSFIPRLSLEEHTSPTVNATFYNRVLRCYVVDEERIKSQIAAYAFDVSRPDFVALRSLRVS